MVCPDCGSNNPATARFCGQCGAILPPRRRTPWLLVALLGAIGLLGADFALFLVNRTGRGFGLGILSRPAVVTTAAFATPIPMSPGSSVSGSRPAIGSPGPVTTPFQMSPGPSAGGSPTAVTLPVPVTALIPPAPTREPTLRSIPPIPSTDTPAPLKVTPLQPTSTPRPTNTSSPTATNTSTHTNTPRPPTNTPVPPTQTPTLALQPNRAPIIRQIVAPAQGDVATSVTVYCDAYDPDGDPLSYHWSANCGLIAGSGASITYMPRVCCPEGMACVASENMISVTVSDGRGGEADGSVTISVCCF